MASRSARAKRIHGQRHCPPLPKRSGGPHDQLPDETLLVSIRILEIATNSLAHLLVQACQRLPQNEEQIDQELFWTLLVQNPLAGCHPLGIANHRRERPRSGIEWVYQNPLDARRRHGRIRRTAVDKFDVRLRQLGRAVVVSHGGVLRAQNGTST